MKGVFKQITPRATRSKVKIGWHIKWVDQSTHIFKDVAESNEERCIRFITKRFVNL